MLSGAGVTQAGLVVGLEGTSAGIPVYGISVRAEKTQQEENAYKLAQATAELVVVKGGNWGSEINKKNLID